MSPTRTNDNVVWVDVLPALDKLMPELRKGLSKVAPQAGEQAGRDFSDGFAKSAVSGVEKASAQIAAARKKEADAAGAVRVAETKLQELRDSGTAKASQLVAAEENLAKVKRTLEDRSDAVSRSTRNLADAQDGASKKSKQLDQDLGRVGDAADRAGRQSSGFGSSLSSSLKLAGGAFLASGVVAGFKSFYDAAAESAKIGRLTEQVITSTGGAAKLSADQVGDLATKISNKTGVDDEAIQSGENLLLTFTNIRNEAGKGNDIFTQTTQAATDMSVALGTDVTSASKQLGKALNDPIKGITALQKSGVSFTASQKDQIKTLVESGDVLGAQKVILGELSKEFGGAAAAASSPLDKLKVNLGNLQEAIGGGLLPVVGGLASFAVNTALPALSSFGGGVKQVYDSLFHGDFHGGPFDEDSKFIDLVFDIRDAFKVIAGFVQDNLTPILTVAGTVLAYLAGSAIVGGITALAGAIGAAVVEAGGVGALLAGLVSPLGLFVAGVAAVVAIFTAAYRESQPLRDAVDRLKASFSVFLDAFQDADAGGGVSGFFTRLGAAITASLPLIGSALADIGRALIDWIEPQIMPALQKLGSWILAIDQWFYGTAVPTLIGAVVSMWAALVDWIGPQIQPAIAQLGVWLQSLGDWITETAVPWLHTAMVAAGQALVAWIQDSALPMLVAINEFLGSLVTWVLGTGLPWLLTTVENLAMALVNWIAPQIPVLLANLGTFLGAALGWIVGTGIPMLIGGLLYLAYELISWVLPQLPGLLGNLAQFIAGAVGWILTTGLPALAAGLFAMAGSAIKSFWEAIEQSPLTQKLEDIFGGIVGIAQRVWSDVKNAFLSGINDVIGLINSFLDAINWVADKVGINLSLHLSPVGVALGGAATSAGTSGGKAQRLAVGGTVAGRTDITGGGTIPGQGNADTVPLYGTPGEIMIRKSIATRFSSFLLALNAGQPEAMQAAGRGRVPSLVQRFAGGGTVQDALTFAKAQEGKPYIWGGVGPAGYDCSGFMSDIANVLAGTPMHRRRFATAAMAGGADAGGFQRLADGGFVIGVDPGSHTAGTLGGVNVESGSGHGPMAGGRALGANSGFQYKYTFPQAGFFRAALGDGAQAIANPILSSVRGLADKGSLMQVGTGAASTLIQRVVDWIGGQDNTYAPGGGDSGREPAAVTAARRTLAFANGGTVPGSGGVDSVAAWLTPDERVLTPIQDGEFQRFSDVGSQLLERSAPPVVLVRNYFGDEEFTQLIRTEIQSLDADEADSFRAELAAAGVI